MARPKRPELPTHVAHLSTGETAEYWGPPHGAHPTHWSFGGEETVDSDGNKRRAAGPVRVVPVVSVHEKAHEAGQDATGDDFEDYDDE